MTIKLRGVIIEFSEQDTVLRPLLDELWGLLAQAVQHKAGFDINTPEMGEAISLNRSIIFPIVADLIYEKVKMETAVDAFIMVKKQCDYMNSVYNYALDRYKVDFKEDSIAEPVLAQIESLLPKINTLVARNASLDEGYRLVMEAATSFIPTTGVKH